MAPEAARFLSILIGALALGACNSTGGSQVLSEPAAVSWPHAHRQAKSDRLYAFSAPDVAEFGFPEHRDGRLMCHVSLPPSSPYYAWGEIGVNVAHILYVPVFTRNEILTFAPNCGRAGPTLSDPRGSPHAVAFDNKRDIVYVASASACIEVYEHEATLPARELCSSGYSGARAVAIDGAGNVYATVTKPLGSMYTQAFLMKFPHGHQKGASVLPLDDFQTTYGITFDLKGNLLAFQVYGISIYAPPYNGAPARGCAFGPGYPYYGALDSSNDHLYVGVVRGVNVYSYPSCTYEYSIHYHWNSGPTGVAVDPRSGS